MVLLALTVNEQERSNQKLAKEASVNSFNILDLLATPAYAQNYQAEATKSIFRDVKECAIEHLDLILPVLASVQQQRNGQRLLLKGFL